MRMFFSRILPFIILTFIQTSVCYSRDPEPHSGIVERQQVKSINATQLKLANGMVCCLKSTAFETDEVFFKLAALGGYTSLPDERRFSGELAGEIAWESGLGGMTADQLAVFLYEHSLEFTTAIFPFSRTVEGEGEEASVEAFLQCVNLLFTKSRFTQEGLKSALEVAQDTMNKQSKDSEHSFEAAFLQANTQNFPLLNPMTISDLKKVNFEEAKTFFHYCFSNPS